MEKCTYEEWYFNLKETDPSNRYVPAIFTLFIFSKLRIINIRYSNQSEQDHSINNEVFRFFSRL